MQAEAVTAASIKQASVALGAFATACQRASRIDGFAVQVAEFMGTPSLAGRTVLLADAVELFGASAPYLGNLRDLTLRVLDAASLPEALRRG